MLSLAEYVTARADMERIAQTIEAQVRQEIDGKSKQEAIRIANQYAEIYKTQVAEVLGRSMVVTANNSVDHYARIAGMDHPDPDVAQKIVDAQFGTKYYGATLEQRLNYNEQLLTRRITQSAQANALGSVYTGPMFGSHLATDQRLLLGTVVKIENDTVKEFADLQEHKLVRWTTSHKHRQPDVCDDLASNIDRRVVTYLEIHNLQLDPKGLYFSEDLPVPPHPNCQCEYGLVVGSQVKHSLLERAANEARKLLRKLWGK